MVLSFKSLITNILEQLAAETFLVKWIVKVIDIKLKIYKLETGQRQDDNTDLLLFQFSKHGSLENTGYLNGLSHWGTYLGGCQN